MRKERVLSGIVIAAILIGMWVGMYTPVIDIMMAVLAAAACYEVTKVAGVQSKALKAAAIAFAFALPLGLVYFNTFPISALCIIYVLLLIVMTVADFEHIPFKDLAVSIYASMIIPIGFSTIALVSDFYKVYDEIDTHENAFLLFMAVGAALLTDVFAYEVGSRIGKHKMTPNLSPKKSWEGAIGAVVLNVAFMCIARGIFTHFFALKPMFMGWFVFIFVIIALSILSMVGDLMASLIKRNYDVKDYSNLIPGHGGIMDRFDSVLVVAPTLYVLVVLYML